MRNNSPMNIFPISNYTYVQISCIKYIPLLCLIWPDFIQKSSLFYQQSHGMIQTCVTIFRKSLYSLDDKTRTTVQLITYTVPQNCLSLFTIHLQNCSSFVRLSFDFYVEGHHFSKPNIGRQCKEMDCNDLSDSSSEVLFLSSCLLSQLCLIKVNHLFTLSYPHLFQI